MLSLQGQTSCRCEICCCSRLTNLYLSWSFLPYMGSVELGEKEEGVGGRMLVLCPRRG